MPLKTFQKVSKRLKNMKVEMIEMIATQMLQNE
jgi:hypothetical protein